MDPADRVVGCVLGLALGDALGAPFEFRPRTDIPNPIPALELSWLGHPPGSTTDDTAMARNLVRSLTARAGLDPEDLVRRHLNWFAGDPPDVGNLTRRVLSRLRSGTPRDRAAREVWEERGPEVSAGNGSVMYCAPLGLAYANRPETLLELAPALSALTHWDERCRTAVLAVAMATASLVRGDPAAAAVRGALRAVADRPGGEELEYLTEVAGDTRPVDGPDQGFCLFAAALGLQATVRDPSFEAGVRRIVALGGDTDTNAALAGALLGARDGRGGLPVAWLARLPEREAIEAEAAALVPLAAQR